LKETPPAGATNGGIDGDLELPINVKNAGTRLENAINLVGLEPDDCIPIPAYKAYEAIEKEPNLLYVISINYSFSHLIESNLFSKFSSEENYVWNILSTYGGSLIRDAEDRFVYSMVNRYWDDFSNQVPDPLFRVISARKAINILQKNPKRTPGIGIKSWGTGASAEINVHISINEETKNWLEIHSRIVENGVSDIISAINRKKIELIFDPEV
jgi:hypothetical protein